MEHPDMVVGVDCHPSRLAQNKTLRQLGPSMNDFVGFLVVATGIVRYHADKNKGKNQAKT
jgi:hypothetical protein